jgi:response regulator NasT
VRLNGRFKDSRKSTDISNLITFPTAAEIIGTERQRTRATEGGMLPASHRRTDRAEQPRPRRGAGRRGQAADEKSATISLRCRAHHFFFSAAQAMPVWCGAAKPVTGAVMRIAIIDTSSTRAAIISDGLREAGLDDLVLIDPKGPLAAQIEAARPEVVLINLENPSRDLLEDFFAMSRAMARPIAMFVDQSDAEATGAAIDAGVSAYVVDGLSKQRIKPVIDLAIRRFQAFSRLQRELDEAKNALAERATIDKAKSILMKRRNIGEPEAYALLRGQAMRTNRRIVEIAEAIVTSEALMGDL